ncbi:hypothetical protein DPMN_103320 [Dreissena polymorpha]|uniref:GRF-type domain-containing protein n=1 Tax=Dreissena polymorpha TaxID=45954 RepID=A0A9D4H9T8_DREPO|nr:hypothetical protein DPMN_103320 [Dreissena polymorpha]
MEDQQLLNILAILRSRIRLYYTIMSNTPEEVSMKEIRKEGQNNGRCFFTCNVRTCNYVKWADEQFPIYAGRGKPCTIRTVMKIGPNNGQRYFTYKLPKNKQSKRALIDKSSAPLFKINLKKEFSCGDVILALAS